MTMKSLKDKVVLITGSSEGIGRETAFKFAKEGCKVVLTYLSHKDEGQKAAENCKHAGAGDVLLVPLDVTNDKNIHDVVKDVVQKYKKIDILINNAGVLAIKPVSAHSNDDIAWQIRTNLEGLIKMTRAVLPHLTDTIINISSALGKAAMGNYAVYCATKWGVRGFSQSLAEEIKQKVYTVNPGLTSTKMTNFKGIPAEKVAQIILDTAKGKYNVKPGGDVDVEDIL